jgi:hypothetical protein
MRASRVYRNVPVETEIGGIIHVTAGLMTTR